MAEKIKLPMGIEDFEEMRTMGYYYIDKTGLIRTLLENPGKVNLFTRPRRFGKTLNMSMLKYFFETGTNSALFHGLEIAKEEELCQKYMGKFPVLAISLKNVEGAGFDKAKAKLRSMIGNEAVRLAFLAKSSKLAETERRQFEKLLELDGRGEFAMSEELLENSLLLLSRFLHKHYGQKTIILIDEYDVPLDRAYHLGYYDEMVNLMRILFGQALKTNGSLYFAVLTGCLRISKESIFSGLNNFNAYTVKDVQYNEYFGFSDKEVKELLAFYGFTEKYNAIREWYDGYRFGSLEIYCPWDVVSYCHALKMNPSVRPQNYWVNTSSNNIIRTFIDKADGTTRDEIELLINGGTIKKKIRQELTYRDLDSSIDNLWSILFTTGYLTRRDKDEKQSTEVSGSGSVSGASSGICQGEKQSPGMPGSGSVSGASSGMWQEEESVTELSIPNREIQWIFAEQIQQWFEAETRKDIGKLENFCKAFQENNVPAIEEGFTWYLRKTISIRDANARKEMKENFYHGILLGLFGCMSGWKVRSNAEAGEGYSDISIEIEEEEIGILVEIKYAEHAAFETGCRNALKQIKDRNYEEALRDDGMKTIYRYGIACYKKRCKVLSE